MSKVLTFSRGISEDGNTLFLTDTSTVYGTTLPARATLALVPHIRFTPAGQATQIIAPQAFDVDDVVTFNVDVDGRDGVYYGLFFALPIYSGGPLVEGTVYWDTTGVTPAVKKVVSGILTAVADLTTLTSDPNVAYGELDTLIRVELTKRKDLLQLLLLQKLEALLAKRCEQNEYSEAQRNFNYVRALWVGARIQFCAGNKITAQQYIETANNLGQKILKV